jgi:hypothetical protein
MLERQTGDARVAETGRRVRNPYERGMDDRKVSLSRFRFHNKEEGLKILTALTEYVISAYFKGGERFRCRLARVAVLERKEKA